MDLKIGQGEKVVIAGPAGSGKTTLLQLLDALILPTKGDILYDGISVRTLARKKGLTMVRRRMGVLFQFPEDQFFQETAYDELVFAMRNFYRPHKGSWKKGHTMSLRVSALSLSGSKTRRHFV